MYISALEVERVLEDLAFAEEEKVNVWNRACKYRREGGPSSAAREGARSKVRTINPSTHRDRFVRRRTIKVGPAVQGGNSIWNKVKIKSVA